MLTGAEGCMNEAPPPHHARKTKTINASSQCA
jgi:hypothetical protein